jgi:hypothetical protein
MGDHNVAGGQKANEIAATQIEPNLAYAACL